MNIHSETQCWRRKCLENLRQISGNILENIWKVFFTFWEILETVSAAMPGSSLPVFSVGCQRAGDGAAGQATNQQAPQRAGTTYVHDQCGAFAQKGSRALRADGACAHREAVFGLSPARLAVFERSVFWTDSAKQSVFSVDKFNGTKSKNTIYHNIQVLYFFPHTSSSSFSA